jgi:antitoxin CcdA
MGYDRAAPKSVVNMTLNEDLVRRARAVTPNLSDTVEKLLADFLASNEARDAAEIERDVRTMAAFAAVNAVHGTLADDFPGL